MDAPGTGAGGVALMSVRLAFSVTGDPARPAVGLVADLWRFPVKSFGGERLRRAFGWSTT